METVLEQLTRVQAAIRALETGAQEYQLGGRRVRKADLQTLYARERELKALYDAETYGTRAYAGWSGR